VTKNYLASREFSCRVLLHLAADFSLDSLPDSWPSAIECLAEADPRYWNRLIIPIYASLKKRHLLSKIPSKLRQIVQTRFMDLLALQTGQQIWIKKLIDCLIEEKIPVILMKGAAAVGVLYDQAYSRLSQDIDVLVREVDFERVTEVIKSFGVDRERDKKRVYSEAVRHERNIELSTPLKFYIEPHRALAPDHLFQCREEDIWERSQPHPLFMDDNIRILSVEDSIVFSAIHSFMHQEFEPHHLVDVIRALTRYKPDYACIVELSRVWQCSIILNSLFEQLDFWFDIKNPVPLRFSQRVKRKLGNRILHGPLNPELSDPGLGEQIISMILHDSCSQVIVFSGYYFHKRVMDIILRFRG